MTEWCMAHPWMTFFICIGVADSIGQLIRVRLVFVRRRK